MNALVDLRDVAATRSALERAWERSDHLFDLLTEDAILAQPIPLRQPFVFYLGHLPAFAWNTLGRRLRGQPPLNSSFEQLFERGIDPIGVDAYVPANAWPERREVEAYRDHVRTALCSALEDAAFPLGEEVVRMVF